MLVFLEEKKKKWNNANVFNRTQNGNTGRNWFWPWYWCIKIVAKGVNALRNKERSFLIITHYQRLLDYIKPDFVHVLMEGKIAKSGCMELAEELEKVGYEKLWQTR